MSSNRIKFFPSTQVQVSKSLVSPQALESVVSAALNIGFSIGATYLDSSKFKNPFKNFEKHDEPLKKNNHEEQFHGNHDPLIYTSDYKPR